MKPTVIKWKKKRSTYVVSARWSTKHFPLRFSASSF